MRSSALRRTASIATLATVLGCGASHAAYEGGTNVAGYRVLFVADPLIVGERNDVTVSLTRNGAAIDDASVRLGLTMPDMQMPETHQTLATRGGGRYDGRLRLAMSGRWRARVTLRALHEPETATSFDFTARDR